MKYDPALDGMRAVAILAVVAFHAYAPFAQGGYFGVDLFFVLSGFLITRLLAAEHGASGTIDLRRFYRNRLVRLMPLLMLVVAVVFAAGMAPASRAVVALLYLTDLVAPFDSPFGVLSHTWSLSVEEHFYLLWPLVLPMILRARNPAAFAFGLWAATGLWRMTAYPAFPGEATYYRFDARLSGLLLGSAVALARLDIGPERLAGIGRLSLAVLVLALLTMPIFTPVSMLLAQPLVEIAAAGLLLTALHEGGRLRAGLSHPWLVMVGRWSYGIYLWHYPIAVVLRERFDWPVTLALTLAVSVPLAALTYRAVELPFRRFRRDAPRALPSPVL
jgi:peptidoglycan/LPS O-acetylase OafA/YrhL